MPTLVSTQGGKQALFVVFKVFCPPFGYLHLTVLTENVNIGIQLLLFSTGSESAGPLQDLRVPAASCGLLPALVRCD